MSRMTLSSMCLIRNPQCPPSTPLLDPLFLTHFQQRYCHDNFKVSSLGSTNVIHEPWGYWEEGPSVGQKAQRPWLNKPDRVPFWSEANCCSDPDLVLMTFSRTNKTKLYHVWWLMSSRPAGEGGWEFNSSSTGDFIQVWGVKWQEPRYLGTKVPGYQWPVTCDVTKSIEETPSLLVGWQIQPPHWSMRTTFFLSSGVSNLSFEKPLREAVQGRE